MEERPGYERTSLRRRQRWPRVVLLLAVLAGLLAVGLWFLRETAPPPRRPAAPEPAPVAETPAPPPAPVAPATAEEMRPLLETASEHPLYRRALAQRDLPRRWALVTDLLSRGESPRKPLAFLAPRDRFSVERRGGATAISAASYARYDGFADAVASVDAAALVRAYRALHDVVEDALRALGYPTASLDDVTSRALQRVIEAPVRDGDVLVMEEEGLYRFVDPTLEGQNEVEKHLLRMGPENTRRLQAKARELQAALRGPG
jgi:hypothetical protein